MAWFWKAFNIWDFEGLIMVCVFESSLFEASLLESTPTAHPILLIVFAGTLFHPKSKLPMLCGML